ncbi:hypothetical protein [Corynebacterium glutamicum]|uniref:hypothetical protein n=1 Tax=Corynebacterium glutamicum TaxID=1718 RepID=UPI0009423F0F|nr:hypothetical protein [Corynebacterium glutamicum]OKX86682.1 hypothetical protein AUO96_08590 [Corynebacterium glutamicum]QDX74322.1 hypothetical protein AKL15_00370 [Corynebacterium glutamicum]QDX77080.1 hypothetical protein AKL16_00370 [Corynebacterium glutamicum]TWS37011.1 hypothetical protein AKJ20_01970 [Corynebacterium glutamicum]TWS37801.1 hypothetical protein AKJ19_00200 [Corynebacterium glutamicum]
MPLNATALETIKQPIKDGFLILINFVLDCYGLIMQIFGVPWTDTFQALGTVGAVAVALGIAVVDFFQNIAPPSRLSKSENEEERSFRSNLST